MNAMEHWVGLILRCLRREWCVSRMEARAQGWLEMVRQRHTCLLMAMVKRFCHTQVCGCHHRCCIDGVSLVRAVLLHIRAAHGVAITVGGTQPPATAR